MKNYVLGTVIAAILYAFHVLLLGCRLRKSIDEPAPHLGAVFHALDNAEQAGSLCNAFHLTV